MKVLSVRGLNRLWTLCNKAQTTVSIQKNMKNCFNKTAVKTF